MLRIVHIEDFCEEFVEFFSQLFFFSMMIVDDIAHQRFFVKMESLSPVLSCSGGFPAVEKLDERFLIQTLIFQCLPKYLPTTAAKIDIVLTEKLDDLGSRLDGFFDFHFCVYHDYPCLSSIYFWIFSINSSTGIEAFSDIILIVAIGINTLAKGEFKRLKAGLIFGSSSLRPG